MINMIRSDIYRLLRSKVLIIPIALVLYAVIASVVNIAPAAIGTTDLLCLFQAETIVSQPMMELIKEKSYGELQELPIKVLREMTLSSGYQYDRAALSCNFNMLYFVLVAAGVSINQDFTCGCIKNTLSSAVGRGRYFASKVLVVNLAAIAGTAVHSFIIFWVSRIINGSAVSAGGAVVFRSFCRQIPAIMALTSVYVLLAFVVRSGVLYNILGILLPEGFSLIYLLTDSVKRLHFLQKYDIMVIMLRSVTDVALSYTITSSLVCVAVMALSYGAGYTLFRRLDIK